MNEGDLTDFRRDANAGHGAPRRVGLGRVPGVPTVEVPESHLDAGASGA